MMTGNTSAKTEGELSLTIVMSPQPMADMIHARKHWTRYDVKWTNETPASTEPTTAGNVTSALTPDLRRLASRQV